jgi:dnaB-like protein helicase-like protein
MHYHCDPWEYMGADVGSLPPLEIDNEGIISNNSLNVDNSLTVNDSNNNETNKLWSGSLDVKNEHKPEPAEDVVPFCVVKNTITNLFAPAGSGKSFLAVAIARTALITDRVKEVWYVDGDNSLRTVFQRDILAIAKENKNFHYVNLNNPHISQISGIDLVKNLIIASKRDLSDVLIVFDSLKDFTASYDIMKDSDMREFFGLFMAIRDYQHASIIFLSHTNKAGETYKGSTSVIDSIETAYLVHPKNKGDDAKKSGYLDYYLEGVKAREGGMCVWVRVDAVSKHIQVEGIDYQGYDKERDQRYIEKIAITIRNNPGICHKELAKKLRRNKKDKRLIKILNEFTGNFWSLKIRNKKKCYFYNEKLALQSLYERKNKNVF